MTILTVVYVISLYNLQLLREERDIETINTTSYTTTLSAARGDILDRNGILLATSRAVYNLAISRDALMDAEDPNSELLRLARMAQEQNIKYIDTFPMTQEAPFTYLEDMSDTQESRLQLYFEYFSLDPNISASDLFVWMKNHYGLDFTTSILDTRLMIGIRYELELRLIMNISQYVFARDVSTDFIAYVEAKAIPGVFVEVGSVREYTTDYAAHVLGYTGLIGPEDSEKYEELSYAMDSAVGKTGVELAFEQFLHGTDGRERVVTNSNGTVIGVEVREEATPGSNVYISIDIGLQEVAEKSLANVIRNINNTRDNEKDFAKAGAVVAIDVKTGEVLVDASYPTYNLSTLFDGNNFQLLSEDETLPLFNRSTQGRYNPGSTFKMVTSLAGLRSGKINRWTTVTDTGKYMAYEGYHPVCWIYSSTGAGHGTLDIVGALENSCNYYYYWLGDVIGQDIINEATVDFGLTLETGIEIPERAGILGTPDYKETEIGEPWYKADTLMSAIGQGYDMITPIQLANYVAMIANDGLRYDLTLMNSVRNWDYTGVIYEQEPVVAGEIAEKDFISILQEGMTAVADSGTAAGVFEGYPVSVAAKTGTVESANDEFNNGVFVCYAPADDPEIAIALIVEKGQSGSTIMSIARDMLDYYFSTKTTDSGYSGVHVEGNLIP